MIELTADSPGQAAPRPGEPESIQEPLILQTHFQAASIGCQARDSLTKAAATQYGPQADIEKEFATTSIVGQDLSQKITEARKDATREFRVLSQAAYLAAKDRSNIGEIAAALGTATAVAVGIFGSMPPTLAGSLVVLGGIAVAAWGWASCDTSRQHQRKLTPARGELDKLREHLNVLEQEPPEGDQARFQAAIDISEHLKTKPGKTTMAAIASVHTMLAISETISDPKLRGEILQRIMTVSQKPTISQDNLLPLIVHSVAAAGEQVAQGEIPEEQLTTLVSFIDKANIEMLSKEDLAGITSALLQIRMWIDQSQDPVPHKAIVDMVALLEPEHTQLGQTMAEIKLGIEQNSVQD